MSSDEVNYAFEILKAVEKVNANQKLHLVEKIKGYYNGDIQGKHFALWGLVFKSNTDDIREDPALSIIEELTVMGATITVYNPEAMPNVQAQIGDKVNYATNQYEALHGAVSLIIATEWSEFKTPDFRILSKKLIDKEIFDGRNLYELDKFADFDIKCKSIGRTLYC